MMAEVREKSVKTRKKCTKEVTLKPKIREKKTLIEAGLKGFFCTCSFRENVCIRETYKLLYEYVEKIKLIEAELCNRLPINIPRRDNDLSPADKDCPFKAMITGVPNCIFIKTNLDDPTELASFIIANLVETKVRKTRYLLRFIPVLATCKAETKDIIEAANPIFSKYFRRPRSYSILFNTHQNTALNELSLISKVEALILLKNVRNKADSDRPRLTVILEVVKAICLISIVPKYFERKKYNLFDICNDSYNSDDSI